MKSLTEIISEKLKIDKNTKLIPNLEINLKEKSNKASDGACIDVDLTKSCQFMLYDENSGSISTFECDDYTDLINDWGMEESDAKKLYNLNKGESYLDDTGAITTRIN